MPAHPQTSTAAIVAAGRHLLEERGLDALTMRDVADAVGVRAPSLYKGVRSRSDLFRLVLEDVTDELTAVLDAAASCGDPVADLWAMLTAYRRFAHANPVAYTLTYAPSVASGATERSVRSSATLLRAVTDLVGPQHALPAARTIVASRRTGSHDVARRSVPAYGDIEQPGLRPGPDPDRRPARERRLPRG